MDDQQFRQLLNFFEFSWSGYRKVRKGVKKRIHRHMSQLGRRNMDDYLAELRRNPEARRASELMMSVSISRFFRDREFWHTLENSLLPELFNIREEKIKVWSAGCACGDEVYSFLIVWDCLQKKSGYLPELDFLATDINPTYLDKARRGVYAASSLKEVNKEHLAIYFYRKKSKKSYTVEASLARDVVWKNHHLLEDSPGLEFDIIFLRNNVLTYYEDRLKQKAFGNVADSLSPEGLLVIGSHESLPPETEGLVRVSPHPFVFRKQG
jgi:chemotaxis methyl-accepting protein methylase